jgi:hypothetical protein
MQPADMTGFLSVIGTFHTWLMAYSTHGGERSHCFSAKEHHNFMYQAAGGPSLLLVADTNNNCCCDIDHRCWIIMLS